MFTCASGRQDVFQNAYYYYYYYALPILQFTNYIQHLHNLSHHYGRVYATAFANYSSPYKTNITHFKLRTNRPIFTHAGNSPQNRNIYRSIEDGIDFQLIILGEKLVGGNVNVHFNQWNNEKVQMRIDGKVVSLFFNVTLTLLQLTRYCSLSILPFYCSPSPSLELFSPLFFPPFQSINLFLSTTLSCVHLSLNSFT